MNHAHQNHGGISNYNILFCTNNNRHESPVRDYQQPLFKREEEQYKDYYGVSNFKFPDVTTTVFRTNHANFCELTFDGTKSTKHRHRRNNTIKRVTSATTINCTAIKQEPVKSPKEKGSNEETQVIEKNKDTMTFHHLAEQFKKKLKFLETPVKLNKSVATNPNGSTFEVILSPKTPTSYSSIEAMSNILQSSDHRPKQILLTSKTFHPSPNKPDMHDREIQTAIIGIQNINNVDECFNMSLASVNDIFCNMDFLPANEDLFDMKRKKRRKLNLTMTHLPCVEIKCSSILFEMPAVNTHRPQMPRRTIKASNNSIIEDFNEASNIIEEKVSEPVSITLNSSEATDNLKDKIFSLFNDTQIAASEDFAKKVNDLCLLIGNLLTEKKSKHDKKNKKIVKIPSEMFINIKKLKAGDTDQQNTLIMPTYSSAKTFHKNNVYQKSSSNPSTPQYRSRSVSPPSRPSTPSCQISKIPVVKSNNQLNETSPRSESNESRSKKKCFDSSPQTSYNMQNHSKISFTSVPSVSTISNESHNTKMIYNVESNEKKTPQLAKPVPRNVFLIPPHVNEILKKSEYNTASNIRRIFGDVNKPTAANNNPKPNEIHLVNILKKGPIKQSWVVPDFASNSQPKCDSINNFQCAKNVKTPKKADHEFGGPSVTFSSMVDVFGGDNASFEERMCSTPDPKTFRNTIVPVTDLKKSKTYPNKPELNAANDREVTNEQNCGLYTVRQTENKPRPIFEKQASFYNSNLAPTKKEITISCLQKRKDYDNKLKMQLHVQNKHASKIPLPSKVIEQENNAVKNETSKANKSKLPLKIRNEVINNQQANNRSNVQEISKLFTTDIKDTPFSKLISENTPRKQESQLNTPRLTSSVLKNTLNNIVNKLNVTKDVSNSINQEKDIIFIKYPEPNFHKTRYKFKVDSHVDNVDNKTKLNTTDAENSLFLKFLNCREKLKKRRKSFCSHQNIIFVYRNKDKSFSNVHKKDSLTKRNKVMKQMRKDENKKSSYSKIYEEKFNIAKDVKFKSSVTKTKPKKNKVTFMEPKQWASLCKIQRYNKCTCEEKRNQQEQNTCPKNLPQKKKICKKSQTKCLHEESKKCVEEKSKINPPQLDSNIIKSCYDKVCSGCGICNKQKENNVTDCKKSRKCNDSKEIPPPTHNTPESTTNFKQMADNLIACCTTLCCNVNKDAVKNSAECVPRSKPLSKECKCHQAHYLYVKPSKKQKIYKTNSLRMCNTCFISNSKGLLAKRRKPNPAWKFKELIFNKVPNDLYNIIKHIQIETFNKYFLHLPINEKQNLLFDRNADNNFVNGDTKRFTKIFPISENSEDTIKFSTIRIGGTIENIPNCIRNIQIINKGRFSKKNINTIGNSQTTSKNKKIVKRKIVDRIFIPTSPRKIIPFSKTVSSSSRQYNDVKEEFLLFPNKQEDTINHISTSPKTIEYLKQNIPTFPFPWIRNISTSPVNVEDFKQKITNVEKQNGVEQYANIEDTLHKNEFEDRPIMTCTPKKLDDTKIDNNTALPAFPSPRKRLRDIHPVIFDRATRKLYENKPKMLISPRHIYDSRTSNRLEKISNTKLQSNEIEDCSTPNIQFNDKGKKHTVKTIRKIKTKLPILKTRRDISINHSNTKLLIPKEKVEKTKLFNSDGDIKIKTDELNKNCARRFVTARKRQITKLVIESNEIVHIPDDDIISLKSKESRESKSTEYKSVITYSRLSSSSHLSISSNSKKASSTSRTFFSLIGNFFRRYSKKVKKKKSKLINENG